MRTPPAVERIVVGVDGSDAAAAALAWAGRLARGIGAEVIVAHIFEPNESELPPDRFDQLRAQTGDRLAGEWSAALDDCGVPHRPLLLSGSPADLLDAAEQEDADLVVVGPRGHGGFAALHIGSTAHHLAHHTTRPLAIVPAPGATHPVNRIVLGLDGSPGSSAAAHWTARLAAGLDAEVLAVCAVERQGPGPPGRSVAGCEEQLRGAWVEPLLDAGVKIHPIVTDDAHPVAALSAAARQEDAGLIVVGVRGLGGFAGLRLGRVPLQLVHHTQIPVGIVPAASTERDVP